MSKKKRRYKEATYKDKEHFRHLLADEEELVLVTGFGQNYLRHRFALYMMLPGGILWIAGVGIMYWYLATNPLITKDDLWRLSLGIGLLLGMVLSMIYAYLQVVWHYHAHRYFLTTRRVIMKNGLLSVRLTSALYDKITHIEVDQSLFDRLIMGHGHLILNTAGMHKDELRLKNIDSPIEFKNIMERLINRERENMGRVQGPSLTVDGEVV
jgi:membrane protein YdbS with pleckstrin-like domain